MLSKRIMPKTRCQGLLTILNDIYCIQGASDSVGLDAVGRALEYESKSKIRHRLSVSLSFTLTRSSDDLIVTETYLVYIRIYMKNS